MSWDAMLEPWGPQSGQNLFSWAWDDLRYSFDYLTGTRESADRAALQRNVIDPAKIMIQQAAAGNSDLASEGIGRMERDALIAYNDAQTRPEDATDPAGLIMIVVLAVLALIVWAILKDVL